MPQSHSQVIIHTIFSTKNRQPFIRPEIEPELFAYMADSIKRDGGIPLLINGVADHVHLLSTLPRTVTQAKLVENIKRNSSRWIKSKGVGYQKFAWQSGYGIFSVSPSKKASVEQYIANQKEHHKTETFQDEFRRFLRNHGLDWDERYVWD